MFALHESCVNNDKSFYDIILHYQKVKFLSFILYSKTCFFQTKEFSLHQQNIFTALQLIYIKSSGLALYGNWKKASCKRMGLIISNLKIIISLQLKEKLQWQLSFYWKILKVRVIHYICITVYVYIIYTSSSVEY